MPSMTTRPCSWYDCFKLSGQDNWKKTIYDITWKKWMIDPQDQRELERLRQALNLSGSRGPLTQLPLG